MLPDVRLSAPTQILQFRRPADFPTALFDAGIYFVAGPRAIEIHAERSPEGFWKSRVVPTDGEKAYVLPRDSVTAEGLRSFVQLRLISTSGRVVAEAVADLCPGENGGAVRSDPHAPETSPYSEDACTTNPNAKSALHALSSGWATSIDTGALVIEPDIVDGRYNLEATINSTWATPLNIRAANATATSRIDLVTEVEKLDQASSPTRPSTGETSESQSLALHVDQVSRANLRRAKLPDLLPLAPFDINVSYGGWNGDPSRKYLSFSSSVWNAGDGPLVLEGYRVQGFEDMRSFQVLKDARGDSLLAVTNGLMFYDASHEHWHVADFARYELISQEGIVVTGQDKFSICLVPTDAIDVKLPGADLRPWTVGLEGACGGPQSLSVGGFLPVGWADTYLSYFTGQELDITDVAPGLYSLRVTVNPYRRILETDYNNNVTEIEIDIEVSIAE